MMPAIKSWLNACSAKRSLAAIVVLLTFCGSAVAQEVAYSWLDLSFKSQDFDR